MKNKVVFMLLGIYVLLNAAFRHLGKLLMVIGVIGITCSLVYIQQIGAVNTLITASAAGMILIAGVVFKFNRPKTRRK